MLNAVVHNLKALNCTLNHCGHRLPAGRLALTSDHGIAWQYAPEIIQAGLQLAPFSLPLNTDTHQLPIGRNLSPRHGLPGFIADALPDRWGSQLMEKALRAAGLKHINPLDKLAWQSNRALGALEFAPEHKTSNAEDNAWSLATLQQQTRKILDGQQHTVADQLHLAGGSAGGAYPKYTASINGQNQLRLNDTLIPKGYRPVILKVPHDTDTYCRIEHSYAHMAAQAGINVPHTQLLMDEGQAWYAIDRFDRSGPGFELKQHQCTLAGILDRDFDIHTTSAEDALSACQQLTGRHADVIELFKRIVFNWMGHNCDDHAKNFSFQLDENHEWRLAPWYDGAWCQSDQGHAMAIDGWRIAGERSLYLKLAKQMGIRNAGDLIDEVLEALTSWPRIATKHGVPQLHIEQIQRQMNLD